MPGLRCPGRVGAAEMEPLVSEMEKLKMAKGFKDGADLSDEQRDGA